MKYWLVAIIGALTFVSAYISSAVSFADKRFKWYKWIKKNVWIFVVINGSIALLSGLQVYLNDLESEKKEEINRKEQNYRDYSLRKEYNRLERQSDSLTTEILAKYGLKFDSAQNRLEKILKDSSKTKLVLPSVPVVALCVGNQIQVLDTVSFRKLFRVNLCSYQAGSTNFKLLCNGGALNEDGSLTYIGNIEFDFPTLKLASGHSVYKDFRLATHTYYEELFFYVRGRYTNLENTKTYYVDELYTYSLRNKLTLVADGQRRKDMIAFLKDKK